MSKKKLVILALVVALIVAFFAFDLGRFLSLDYIKSRQAEFTALAGEKPLAVGGAFFAVYVAVCALSLPGAAIMTLAAGAIFGLGWGTLIVSFASAIGATLALLASRYILRDSVQSKFGARLADIDKGIEREGAFYLFTLRLVPIFPFFIINLLMGLTKMKAWTFYWVSQIGMLAGTLVYVNAGTQLAKIESLKGILSPGLIGSFVLLGVFPLVAKKIVDVIKARKVYAKWAHLKPKSFDRNLVVIGAGGDDDAFRRQRLLRSVVLGDFDMPRARDLGAADGHIDAERRVALDRVVRFDGAHDTGDALHHVGEVNLRRRFRNAVVLRVPDLPRQRRRLDQRLARHAAVVQAVAAHLVRLDQRHLGLDHGGDVARHQARGTSADDDQVAVEGLRLDGQPLRIDLARLHAVDDLLGDQWQQAEQHEGADQPRIEDALQGVEPGQLRAGEHVDNRTGEHAELAGPIERPGAHLRQAEEQVDRGRWKGRNQTQRDEVERPVLGNARIDLAQPSAEARLHAVAQHITRREKGQQGPDRGGERNDDRADDHAEECAADQRHHRTHRQRQREDGDVEQRVGADHQQRPSLVQRRELGLSGFDVVEAEEAAEVEGEERHDQGREQRDDQDFFLRHGFFGSGRGCRNLHAQPRYRERTFAPPTIRVPIVIAHSTAKP